MTRPLVLASTSRYRRELLERLGLPFVAAAPRYEEEQDLPLPPDGLVIELATRKARSLAALHPEARIVGCDQVVSVDGRILGKPGTEDAAVRQLLAMAGRTHRLLTGLVVLEPATGRLETALDVHEVAVRPLDEARARAYVRRDRPLDCAGSLRVESLGIALLERLRGDDYTAVIGLPLIALTTLLARFGVRPIEPSM